MFLLKVLSYRDLRSRAENLVKKHVKEGKGKEEEPDNVYDKIKGPQDVDNFLLMGGNLLLERDTGSVLLAHRSKVPSDRPSAEEIIAAAAARKE